MSPTVAISTSTMPIEHRRTAVPNCPCTGRVTALMAAGNAVCTVLHPRLARQLNISRVVWTAEAHWQICGQSCPCCRAAHGEGFGSCHACEACADAMTIGALIAAFVRDEHETQAVLAALGGSLGTPGRPMPHAVMTAITHMVLGH